MREWIYQAHRSEVSAERQDYDSGLVIFYVYVVCDFSHQLTVRKLKKEPNLSDIDQTVLNASDSHFDEVSAM